MIKTLYLLIIASIIIFPVSTPISLLAGFVFTLLFGNPFIGKSGRYTSLLLKTAIVGLGFGINFSQALEASSSGFILTIVTIVGVLILGVFVGRLFRIPPTISYLIASGTAICGGSAIAAIAPVIKADESEMSISLAVIFTLNSIALLLFPFIGEWLGMLQEQFGIWAAVAIHDTSSVVGAAKYFGDDALVTATTVKLARALWIIPLTLFTAFLYKSGKKPKLPYFILMYIAAVIINTYTDFPADISLIITFWAKKAMVITIFLIGSSLSIEKIKKTGLKPFAFGSLLWILISVGTAIWILA